MKKSKDELCCYNCRYYCEGYSECVRYPPQVIAESQAEFPKVKADMICGEHKQEVN